MTPSLLHAEVFLPGEGFSLPEIFPLTAPVQVWDEPITLNGYETRLTLNLYKNSLVDFLVEMRRKYPEMTCGIHDGVMVLDLTQNQQRKRYLITEQNDALLSFEMILPLHLPPPQWHPNIPMISSATPILETTFPERGTLSMQFTTHGNPGMNAEMFATSLESSGWIKTAPVTSSSLLSAGGLFLSADGERLLAFSMSSSRNQSGTQGVILINRIK